MSRALMRLPHVTPARAGLEERAYSDVEPPSASQPTTTGAHSMLTKDQIEALIVITARALETEVNYQGDLATTAATAAGILAEWPTLDDVESLCALALMSDDEDEDLRRAARGVWRRILKAKARAGRGGA